MLTVDAREFALQRAYDAITPQDAENAMDCPLLSGGADEEEEAQPVAPRQQSPEEMMAKLKPAWMMHQADYERMHEDD